jgi:hypothetical protein
MTKRFNERMKAIEAQMRKTPGAGTFAILQISGCLPGPVNFAYAGSHRFDRAEGEDFEAFVLRSALAAFKAGEMSIIVGGLPRSDEYAKYRRADGEFDFDRWWSEVVAPHYPDVPPEEPAGFQRRSRLGFVE